MVHQNNSMIIAQIEGRLFCTYPYFCSLQIPVETLGVQVKSPTWEGGGEYVLTISVLSTVYPGSYDCFNCRRRDASRRQAPAIRPNDKAAPIGPLQAPGWRRGARPSPGAQDESRDTCGSRSSVPPRLRACVKGAARLPLTTPSPAHRSPQGALPRGSYRGSYKQGSQSLNSPG